MLKREMSFHMYPNTFKSTQSNHIKPTQSNHIKPTHTVLNHNEKCGVIHHLSRDFKALF